MQLQRVSAQKVPVRRNYRGSAICFVQQARRIA
jgi:hypothetical protein